MGRQYQHPQANKASNSSLFAKALSRVLGSNTLQSCQPTSAPTSSLLAKARSRGRENNTPEPAPSRARPQPDNASFQRARATSTTSSLLAKALSRGREGSTPLAEPTPTTVASENDPTSTPTPELMQPVSHDAPKPARHRVPAVTSKAMTTKPRVRDKSRPHRRKYPTNRRQRH